MVEYSMGWSPARSAGFDPQKRAQAVAGQIEFVRPGDAQHLPAGGEEADGAGKSRVLARIGIRDRSPRPALVRRRIERHAEAARVPVPRTREPGAVDQIHADPPRS